MVDGLVMIILLALGAIGGYCFAALMFHSDRPYPPRPADPHRISDTEVRRIMRDWDNR